MSLNSQLPDPAADRVPGPDHRAGAVATQVAHPWLTAARTAVQVGIPALLALVLVLPEVLAIVSEGMGDQLPDGLRLWLAGAAAFVTALAATLARLMAVPAVNDALGKLRAPRAG